MRLDICQFNLVCPGVQVSYESRFAELSRRLAGRKMHCFPSRAHLWP